MTNYNIILDEEELHSFIDFLPELEEGECYYVSLFARKKYHESAQHDKSNLKRFSARTKELLLKKLKQLELKDECYFNRNGLAVHNDALAVYISINPRSYKKAQRLLLKKIVDVALDETNTKDPSSLGMTCLHKSKSRTVYVDFDFDGVDFDEVVINQYLNKDAYHVLHTRGGFHLLVEPDKVHEQYKKSWYTSLSKLDGCDVTGDTLVPIAGCTQGTFIPRLIK